MKARARARVGAALRHRRKRVDLRLARNRSILRRRVQGWRDVEVEDREGDEWVRHRQQGLLLQVAKRGEGGTIEGVSSSRGGWHAGRCGLLLGALALVALALAGTATSASALAALLGMSSDSAGPPPGLIVKIKKTKNCTVVFVCDFFNPATSCANPPCCKKGHTEKECKPAGAPATTPAPEPASGQCNLCTNKGDCSPAGNSRRNAPIARLRLRS